MRLTHLTCITCVAAWATTALGQSNIDATNKRAWGENIGWTDWREANGGADGVVVGVDFLTGFIWSENCGWINVGNGNGPYGNNDDTDFGVNILPNGDLAGLGWGENIGWVNFDTISAAPDQARFDFGESRFKGYAWGENVGWINLDETESGKYVAATFAPSTGVPVLSQWPLAALAALWATAGLLMLRRRRVAFA